MKTMFDRFVSQVKAYVWLRFLMLRFIFSPVMARFVFGGWFVFKDRPDSEVKFLVLMKKVAEWKGEDISRLDGLLTAAESEWRLRKRSKRRGKGL